MLKKTGKWRNIIELSIMSNNDEVIFHTDCEIDREEWYRDHEKSGERLVISRPVFQIELDEGLELHGKQSVWDKKYKQPPAVTKFCDEIWQLRSVAEFWIKKAGQDVPKFMTHQVLTQYYDPMSGGMGKYALSFARFVFEEANLPPDHEIFMGITIGQFLQEIKDIPDFREILPKPLQLEAQKLLTMD